MIQKRELEYKLSAMNLDFYETTSDVDTTKAIGLNGIDDLFRFIRNHSIDTVFYYYEYASPENLEIVEDIIEEIKNDIGMNSDIEDEINEYNEKIYALDYSIPDYMVIYCIYEGTTFFVDEYDFWFENAGYGHPKAALIRIVEQHIKDIEESRKIEEEKRELGRQQLREHIINDKEFHRCTNVRLRREYTARLFNKNKELQSLFVSEGYGLYDISATSFIEIIWREYKDSL